MYEQVQPKKDLLAYRASIIEALLRDMAFAIQRTLKKPDASTVHDLRRLSLRLRHALRFFGRVLPSRPVRKVQRRLKILQALLGSVRSCDVALDTLLRPGLAEAASKIETRKVTTVVGAERRRGLRPLRVRLRKMQRADSIGRWRSRLLAA